MTTKIKYDQILGAPVNVLDFGADPTGVTDSALAFTEAEITASPGAVYVPIGTYYLSYAVNGKFFSYGAVVITGGPVTSITNLVP